MYILVSIRYKVDDPAVNDSVAVLLENTLPFMADNVTIHFDTEGE